MNDMQWNELTDRIEQKFGILERDTGVSAQHERTEWVEFACPLGNVKLVRTQRPRVVGETAMFSKRIGANVAVKKVFDENEKVSFITAYVWNDAADDWRELKDAQNFSF